VSIEDADEAAELLADAIDVHQEFVAAFDALTVLYSDQRVEEYTAGGIEELAHSLAAVFGFTVDPSTARLVPTPSCNDPREDDK
jgi:hypothetical protein